MTDIVERLRDISAGPSAELEKLGKEAADEIDNLREELSIWKSVFPDIAPSSVLPDRSLLEAEIERLRAALESTEAWLERWAVHVGRCEGGHSCTCGLTAAQYEGSAALAYPAPGKEGNTND